MTGTKKESQNVFQDEMLIFPKRKIYFGLEHWVRWPKFKFVLSCWQVRFSITVSSAPSARCSVLDGNRIWLKEEEEEPGGTWEQLERSRALHQFARSRNFLSHINPSSQITRWTHSCIDDGLKPGQDKYALRPILNRCKSGGFILHRCIDILFI